MPRGNGPQSKVHYQGKEEDFVVMVEDAQAVKNWKNDSAPVMAFIPSSPEPGGFLPPTLPSPPASSTTTAPVLALSLPQPRARPLKPGSSKESSFIDHVDRKLLQISRRYEKRFNADMEDSAAPKDEGSGYETFEEVARDLERVIDVVWVPYFLTIALTLSSYLPSFIFSPSPTFHLLRKLDLVFSSLLQGRNVESGDMLPGFEGGRAGLSTTEKVRARGLVERTRVTVVEVAGKRGSVDVSKTNETPTDTEDDLLTTENDDAMEGVEDDDGHGRWEMEIARVYERTIVDLGQFLDSANLGGTSWA
ncbi:MAG: hypothetical protein LQ347_001469 [Umbilicaria vellea]|nr:MAG: hypothetical protein LQ347_001469 [Umbilicaria vellea]